MILQTTWFDTVLAKGRWKFPHDSSYKVGAMGAREVHWEETGERAYIKPGLPNYDSKPFCVAHERIASHLAHLLNMNIPPVLLGFHPENSAFPVCFSQKLGKTQVDWGNVFQDIPQGVKTKAFRCVKGYLPVIPLHIWIENNDIKKIHTLYVEEENQRPLGIFSIDHAFSMLYYESWRKNIFSTPCSSLGCPPPLVRGAHLMEQDKKCILDGVERIQNLEWKQIEKEVINPIPKPFLKPAEKKLVLKGLRQRRDILNTLTQDWLQCIEDEFHTLKKYFLKSL